MTRRIAVVLALDVVGYSAMMEADAAAAVRALNRVFREIVRPIVERGGGRVIKLTGDGALIDFAAAADAIGAAHRIQCALREDQIRLRAGVHAGDVTVSEGDLFGDAINIASRLQAAARPGDGLVSAIVVDLAGGGLGDDIALKREGRLRLKGLSRPVEALSLDIDGVRRDATRARLQAAQQIRFAQARDRARLAWASVGEGPVLVKAPNWISHLELDWRTINAGWISDLAARRRLIRFDQRGNGLSDRDVDEISLNRFVDDLEAVFDAAGIERAPLFCISQGGAVAAAFAARRPERVSGLIAIGAFRQGAAARAEPRSEELRAAQDAMARVGWDDGFPSIRDHFARVLSPEAAPDDQRVYAEAMRETITAETFPRFRDVIAHVDVTDILPRVQCPALVLHATGDRMHPLEQGRSFAAGIPNGRFVALASQNHVMPTYDPAWPLALREIDAFLAGLDDVASD